MDENDNLDILIKKQFDELYSEFEKKSQKFINPNSIKNIIFHLVDNPKINPNQNQKLQELGEIRMKKKLLEYFKAVRNTDLNKFSASDLYKNHIDPIGDFMTDYYGFSSNGGKLVLITIIILLTFGIIIDLSLILLDWSNFPIFTIMFLTLLFVRRTIKKNQNKLIGLFY